MKYKTTKKLPRKLKNNYTKHTQGQVLEQQYRMVLAYRRGKNLGDYLVHSKFSELNDKQNKRRSCRYVGGVGGRVFELPQLIPLNRTNCVYLMSCNECGNALWVLTRTEDTRVNYREISCVLGRWENDG